MGEFWNYYMPLPLPIPFIVQLLLIIMVVFVLIIGSGISIGYMLYEKQQKSEKEQQVGATSTPVATSPSFSPLTADTSFESNSSSELLQQKVKQLQDSIEKFNAQVQKQFPSKK